MPPASSRVTSRPGIVFVVDPSHYAWRRSVHSPDHVRFVHVAGVARVTADRAADLAARLHAARGLAFAIATGAPAR
jgi:hypothetical protein